MKKATATPVPSSAVPSPAIRILKIANCPSLSGKSTLTYHIGCTAESDIKCRVFSNSSSGFFNNEWISLAVIQQMLAKVPGDKTITSYSLHDIYGGKSANSAGFLFALLKNEGLVQNSKEKRRCYECTDATKFFAEVKALIASDVNLKVVEKPARSDMKKEAKSATITEKSATITAKPEKVSKVIVKPAKVDPKAKAVAVISTQQFEPISKQPWPIKEKASKAAPKKV